MQTENNFKKTSNTFFNKKDFVKIGGTVLITLLIVYLFNIFSPLVPKNTSSKSSLISTVEMRDYFHQYIDSNSLPLQYDSSGNQRVGQLEGFRISAIDLDSIIHYNRYNLNNGQRIIPDEVLFYLGQNGTFNDSGQRRGNITIIAVGVKNSQLMTPTQAPDISNKLKASIYDKAMPCPGPGCPEKPPPPPTTSN